MGPLLALNTDYLPADYADVVGREYAQSSTDDHKRLYGQYLTPVAVAEYMAGLFAIYGHTIRILDPGAGTGVLSCALLQQIAEAAPRPTTVELIAYEADLALSPQLIQTLDNARAWLEARDVQLRYEIRTRDFVLDNARWMTDQLSLTDAAERFDLIISNPPYFKLNKQDPRAQAASFVVHGQPNIYAIFMAISAYLLKQGGELVFIVPRSFTAGPYFRLFRERFFALMRPVRVHLFGSRQDAFEKDEVLQEHVILRGVRDDGWCRRAGEYTVDVSFSAGVRDLGSPRVRTAPLSEIIDLSTPNKHFSIPTTDEEQSIIHLVNSWPGSLHTYDMEISTGPVVPFRAEEFIVDENGSLDKVPLLWMQNVRPMVVKWPVAMRKRQYIIAAAESAYLLLPTRNYVLLRRFSAKEEFRRLTAAPFLAADFRKNDVVGFENHVNYIHKRGGELTDDESYGIAALLNCHVLDTYFRTYNGNTQVSATELRSTPLPDLAIIRQVGEVARTQGLTNGDLDDWISNLLMAGQGGKIGEARRGAGNTKGTRITKRAAK